MARKRGPAIKEDLNPNLIPMVDIMFLLLLFFMLGADMSQREQADLVLPTASEVKENEKVKSPEPTTTVNVQHRQVGSLAECPINKGGGYCRQDDHWAYVIQGREVPLADLKGKLKDAADEALERDPD